jgi:pSer/pThr/pTyr-binding forkhead associated (FHA) protein
VSGEIRSASATQCVRRELHILDWPALAPRVQLIGHPGTALQKTWQLRRAVTIIGSRSPAHVRLRSDAISRAHAVILCDGTQPIICDLASRNGTLVSGNVVRWSYLHDSDVIRLGPFEIVVCSQPLPGSRGKNYASGRFPPPQLGPPITLLDEQGRSVLRLAEGVAIIGRRDSADVRLANPTSSPAAAIVTAWQGSWAIYDLGEDDGARTFVNDEPTQSSVLREADVLMIDGCVYRVAPAQDRQPKHSHEPSDVVSIGDDSAIMTHPIPSEQDATPHAPTPLAVLSGPNAAESSLGDLEARLAVLQQDLASSHEQVQDFHRKLDERAAALSTWEQTLRTQADELERRTHEFAEREAALSERECEVAHAREEAAQARAALDALRRELEADRAQLAGLREAATRDRDALTADWARLEDVRSSLQHERASFEAQRREVDEARRTLAEERAALDAEHQPADEERQNT